MTFDEVKISIENVSSMKLNFKPQDYQLIPIQRHFPRTHHRRVSQSQPEAAQCHQRIIQAMTDRAI